MALLGIILLLLVFMFLFILALREFSRGNSDKSKGKK